MFSSDRFNAKTPQKSGKTLKVQENNFIEEFLPQVLETRVVVEVIDKDGNTSGFITEKDLAQSLLTKN